MSDKKLRGKEIDKKILEYLRNIPFSATTEMAAKAVGVSWYTAQNHLVKLEREGKIRFFKVGRQNQFIVASRLRD